jgi:diaminohydroxyphosphoribosylaminopyrimidine deaminase/5-amino-6-(5-phosphoribosylamino)uracil reductase|tara:strand:- start:26521 stop:27693 length:1173 start_codon:yes stop_codon:yes gene_type:complete
VSKRELYLLQKAHQEASRASWLMTAPNPKVGALALKEGHIVGRGFHEAFGGPHAEEAALIDAGAWDEAKDCPLPGVVDEIVVTLEPCSSEGGEKQRQPCVQLLLDAGVTRLLVGAVDPDLRHQSAGLKLFAESGVEVVQVEGGQEMFEELNPAFLQALSHDARPWVLLKWAASLDGKTATDSGESQWLSSEDSREEVHQLRSLPGAILVGYGTLVHDNPALSARPSGVPAINQPLRVFLLPDGQIPSTATAWNVPGKRLWVLAEGQKPCSALAEREGEEDQVFFVPTLPDGKLSLEPLFAYLRQGRGIRRLLVEGGPKTQASCLQEGLADALVRYEAPLLIGGHMGSILGGGVDHPRFGIRLLCEERKAFGEDLRRAFLLQRPGFHSIPE